MQLKTDLKERSEVIPEAMAETEMAKNETEEGGGRQGHLLRERLHCGVRGSHSASLTPGQSLTFPVRMRNHLHFAGETD